MGRRLEALSGLVSLRKVGVVSRKARKNTSKKASIRAGRGLEMLPRAEKGSAARHREKFANFFVDAKAQKTHISQAMRAVSGKKPSNSKFCSEG